MLSTILAFFSATSTARREFTSGMLGVEREHVFVVI
jgi:hypothetical protein